MELQQEKNIEGAHCSGLCCTKVENFCVTIGNTKILENINIHIHCGELTAIIGPNGAGKSTLLKAILGDIKHTGQLQFLDEKGKHSGHPLIGYVPQNLSFDGSTPTSVLDLFMVCNSKMPAWLLSTKKLKKQVLESLTKVNGENLIDKRIGALSGGELQRVLLALALDPIPDLLLLDEPVSGIDQKGLELFYNTVSELRKEYDLSIILVSHDLDLVEKYADRVILINGTVLCSGTPEEVFNDEKTSKVFGMSWYNSRANNDKKSGGQ
ncbi:MAG: metal ABC transporter ATP-binding protein [Eubacteriales bacterium]